MRLLLIGAIILSLAGPAWAQLPVIDAANNWINNQQLFNQLEEMERAVRQLQAIKHQLDYAKRSYERQAESLKKLKGARWDGLGRINDNIRRIRYASNGVVSTNRYLERRYRYLYSMADRLEFLNRDPDGAEQIEKDTKEHMMAEADSLIVSGNENSNSINTDYQRLYRAEEMMNDEELTPEQMRQIQGMIQVMNAQQMAEIKRMIAEWSAFSARQYQLSQLEQAQRDSLQARQDRELVGSMRDLRSRLDTTERSMVPEWMKEDY